MTIHAARGAAAEKAVIDQAGLISTAIAPAAPEEPGVDTEASWSFTS